MSLATTLNIINQRIQFINECHTTHNKSLYNYLVNTIISYLENTVTYRDPEDGKTDKVLEIIKKIYKLKKIYINETNEEKQKHQYQLRITEFKHPVKRNTNDINVFDSDNIDKDDDICNNNSKNEVEKEEFNFSVYQNFSKTILNVLSELQGSNVCIEVEGVENLQKEQKLSNNKPKNVRVSIFRFWVKKVFFSNKIDKSFRALFNWKLQTYCTTLYYSSTSLVCRICENTYPAIEYLIHIYICKQKEFYKSKLANISFFITNQIDKMVNAPEEITSQTTIFHPYSYFHNNFFNYLDSYDYDVKFLIIF